MASLTNMAIRRRTIQPTIWQDPDFAQLQPFSKLVFMGLITQADDYGRLSGHPAIITSELFPFRTSEVSEVMEALEEISQRMKNVSFYEVNGQVYIQLQKWMTHQSLHKDRIQDSLIPPIPEAPKKGIRRTLSDKVGQCPRNISKDKGSKVKGRECKGEQKGLEKCGSIPALQKIRKELEDRGILQKRLV